MAVYVVLPQCPPLLWEANLSDVASQKKANEVSTDGAGGHKGTKKLKACISGPHTQCRFSG